MGETDLITAIVIIAPSSTAAAAATAGALLIVHSSILAMEHVEWGLERLILLILFRFLGKVSEAHLALA